MASLIMRTRVWLSAVTDEIIDMPIVGEIADILVTPSQEVLFVMQYLITKDFEEQYYAYCVHRVCGQIFVCRPSAPVAPYPLTLSRTFSTSNSGLYVRTKYHVFASK